MTATVATVFAIVYVGMILGGLPFLQLDRTGVALLGAIALVALPVTAAWLALSLSLGRMQERRAGEVTKLTAQEAVT